MRESISNTPEFVQARIATFAAEELADITDRTHVMSRLGELATGNIEVVTRTTESGEEQTVATKKEYVDFLRRVGGSRYEAIQGRADILGAYHEFAPAVQKLSAELSDPTARKHHPDFMDDGSSSDVFLIEHEGKKYAVRKTKRSRGKSTTIDSYLAGVVLATDIPRLEHIIAASYEDGVTVAEVMSGTEVSHLTPDQIRQVTDAQLTEYIDTILLAKQRGIVMDPKPSNVFYDPDAGFGVIDITSSKIASNGPASIGTGELLASMAVPIDNAGTYRLDHAQEVTVESSAREGELRAANLEVLKRYRSIVEAKLAGDDQERALREIDHLIKTAQRAVEQYTDPQWVAERIAGDKAWKKEQEELSKLSPEESWTSW